MSRYLRVGNDPNNGTVSLDLAQVLLYLLLS